MISERILAEYLEAVLSGNRKAARSVVEDVMHKSVPANTVYMELIWPIMNEIEKLRRSNRISPAQQNLAVRINRAIVDQLQNKLPKEPQKQKKITICCAAEEIQELGAQIAADLFESDGWEVKFLGGGLTNEDILRFVNSYAPDILLIYGTHPRQAPAIRQLIDSVREIDAHPEMRIMVSGGLFNRAEGLWQEIGADLFACDAQQAVQQAGTDKRSNPQQRTINRRKLKNSQKQTA